MFAKQFKALTPSDPIDCVRHIVNIFSIRVPFFLFLIPPPVAYSPERSGKKKFEKKLLENGREGHRWTSHLLKAPNPWSKLVTHGLGRFEIQFSWWNFESRGAVEGVCSGGKESLCIAADMVHTCVGSVCKSFRDLIESIGTLCDSISKEF